MDDPCLPSSGDPCEKLKPGGGAVQPDWKNAIFVGFLATYAVFDLGKVTQFIYFQF